MNTYNDPLEQELASLRPCEPSEGLRDQIAVRLQDDSAAVDPQPISLVVKRKKSRWRWLAAIAAIGIAAGVAAALLLPRIDKHEVVEPPDGESGAGLASAFDESLPSVWQFRQALHQSPSDLNALLDKHSAHPSEPNPERARVYVFSRFDSEFDSLGEL